VLGDPRQTRPRWQVSVGFVDAYLEQNVRGRDTNYHFVDAQSARIGDTMHTTVVTAFATFDVFYVRQTERSEFKVVATWQIGSLRFW